MHPSTGGTQAEAPRAAMLRHNRKCVRPLFAPAHHLLDQANNKHDDRAAHAASGDLTDDGSKVEPAPGRARDGRDQHAKQLTANPAAYDAGNGIPDGPQTQVLEERTYDISADRAADKLNDQCQQTHGFS
jgi:hypothetical protein